MGFFEDIFGGGREGQAAEESRDIEQERYEQIRKDTAPYRRLGRMGANWLRDVYLTGDVPYEASPGYEFRRGEGERAIDRMMAARGLYGSGARGRALSRYADDLASQEYEQGFNRLATLANIGQQGQAMGQQGASSALARATKYGLAGGQARQSAYDRSSGAAINTLAGLAGMYG